MSALKRFSCLYSGLFLSCLVGCSSPYPALNAFCVIECDAPVNGEWTAAHHSPANPALRPTGIVQAEADRLIVRALSLDMTILYREASTGGGTESAIFGLALAAGRSTAYIDDATFAAARSQFANPGYWLQRSKDPTSHNPSTTYVYVPSPRLGGTGGTQAFSTSRNFTILPDDTSGFAFRCVRDLRLALAEPGLNWETQAIAACGGSDKYHAYKALLQLHPD
jgi:hypothetical protein